MVPPPAHIHHAHHGNGMQPGVEERGGGGGGGVPLYAYGLLGAAAVPAGVMMADAVAGGDKERSRGGAGEERGFPDEDEEEEEDEYGRSVSAHTPRCRAPHLHKDLSKACACGEPTHGSDTTSL